MFLLFSFFYLGLIFIIMSAFILPQFNAVYQDMGAITPWYMFFSGWFPEWFILLYIPNFIFFYVILYFTNSGKEIRIRFYHKFKISPQSVDKIGKLIFFIFLPLLLPFISYLIYVSLYKPLTRFGAYF